MLFLCSATSTAVCPKNFCSTNSSQFNKQIEKETKLSSDKSETLSKLFMRKDSKIVNKSAVNVSLDDVSLGDVSLGNVSL